MAEEENVPLLEEPRIEARLLGAFAKPEPFAGKGGAAAWLAKVDFYFEAVGMQADAQKVLFAGLLLTSSALNWFRTIARPAPGKISQLHFC